MSKELDALLAGLMESGALEKLAKAIVDEATGDDGISIVTTTHETHSPSGGMLPASIERKKTQKIVRGGDKSCRRTNG